MVIFSHTISDPEGLHARPAGLLVREAGKFASTITLEGAGGQADAKRIFSVMRLAVKQGEKLTVRTEGADEQAAAAALEAFVRANL